MSTSDIIQIAIFGIAIIALIASIVYTLKSIKASIALTQEQIKAQIFSGHTRRYNDIIINMPNIASNGKLDAKVLKYTHLYFNLCREEYHLWRDGIIDLEVFNLWKEDMRATIKDTTFLKAWQLQRGKFNSEFKEFFQHEVVDNDTNEKNRKRTIFKILGINCNVLPFIAFCVFLILFVLSVFPNVINDKESKNVITFNINQIQLIVNLFIIPSLVYVLIKIKGRNSFNIYLWLFYFTIAIIDIITLCMRKSEWKWNDCILNGEYIIFLLLFALLTKCELHKIKLACTYFNCSKDKDSQDDVGKNLGFCVRTKDKDFIDVGWGNYAKVLKSRMSHTQLDNGESFAIGISGQWGSGKTTFLYTLEKELGNDFIAIRFMPWYSSSPKTLVQDFFDCVSSKLGSMHIDIDFSKYIELLQEIDTTGVLKIINKLIPHNDNDLIENVKKDIEERLCLIEKKVVIIIDDTDRLRSDELMEMLKIIRLTANFNNVIFVVSYDKVYILEKIKEAGIDNNSEYLKKIFPLEIVLPLVEDIVMSDMFVEELEKSNLNESFVLNIKQELPTKCGVFIFQKYIKNFRDVKNFTNTLIVCNDLLKQTEFENEISYRDIFWIEVIRIYFPELYHILCHERNKILEPIKKYAEGEGLLYEELPAIINDNDKNDKKIKLKISLKEKYGDEIETILQLLFNKDNKDVTSIRLLDNYYKYFSYRLPKNVISIDEFFALLKKNEEEIRNKISGYNNENKIQSLYRCLANFKLNACTKGDLEINNFLIVLFEMVDYYCEINYLIVLFQNNLDVANSEFIDSRFVYNLFKKKLEGKNCKFDKWNKVLASIYPQISSKNPDIENHSILSDKEIEDLACSNCTNYLNTFDPSISEITNEKSDLHKLVKDACVLCSFGTNRSLKRKCLIYDSCLKYYSLHPEKNNINEFMNPFHIGIFEATSEEVHKRVYERQEDLFGSIDKFDEFVQKCFLRPNNRN